jgi:hypothetical protein
VTTGDPPRLRKLCRDAPRDLVTVVEKAIDRVPARRYQAAEDLASDLQRFLDDEPIKARRQTQLEGCVRWARHNPGIAILGGVLAAVLVLVTAASLLAAGHFNRLRLNEALAARSERDARQEAELAREAESSQRRRAVAEKKRADVMLADMLTSRGLLAGERDAPAEAALWFVAAAEQSASAEDARRHEDNRLRARNWLRQAAKDGSASGTWERRSRGSSRSNSPGRRPARRIELGDLSGLTTDQWLGRWKRLSVSNPDLPRSLINGSTPARK